jgi:hypothetical protein
MITAHDLFPDQFAPEAGSDKRLTTWYAQGQSDGFGDRLLMFDNTNAPSWEILRFKSSLTHDSRFEAALRQRVDELQALQHEAFPVVRPIKRLGQDDGLAVVSTYSGGAALAEALKKPRSAEFALRLIRQLVPALTALQRVAPGMAHGALTIDRIILGSDGRLMIREHMVGSAIDTLEWPAVRLWSELGLLVPRSSGSVRVDERTDITQLAIIVLSLMAGRRVGPDDYPDKTSELLDELTLKHHWHNPANPAKFQALRHWLERALQLSGQSFTSAHDAELALADLQDPSDPRATPSEETLRVPPKPAQLKEEAAPPMWSASRGLPPVVQPPKPAPIATRSPDVVRGRLAASGGRLLKMWRSIPPAATRWTSVGLAVMVIAEAVFIGWLLSTGPPQPAVDTRAALAPPPPSRPEIQPIQTSPPVVSAPPLVLPAATETPKLPEIRTPPPPVAAVRSGGVRISAPIELHVLEGERVIGSTVDGPIMTAAGRHEFDFVNSAIGYRVRQVVEVKAGQIVPFTVPVPNGTLNINAQPWATVLIDGNPAGETPLGNLSILPGEHDIVFRHPQFGERREKAMVRPGAETRVAVNFQR